MSKDAVRRMPLPVVPVRVRFRVPTYTGVAKKLERLKDVAAGPTLRAAAVPPALVMTLGADTTP